MLWLTYYGRSEKVKEQKVADFVTYSTPGGNSDSRMPKWFHQNHAWMTRKKLRLEQNRTRCHGIPPTIIWRQLWWRQVPGPVNNKTSQCQNFLLLLLSAPQVCFYFLLAWLQALHAKREVQVQIVKTHQRGKRRNSLRLYHCRYKHLGLLQGLQLREPTICCYHKLLSVKIRLEDQLGNISNQDKPQLYTFTATAQPRNLGHLHFLGCRNCKYIHFEQVIQKSK